MASRDLFATAEPPIQREWLALVRRLQWEASQTLGGGHTSRKGCALITAHVILDRDGQPILWIVDAGRRIEPTKDGQEVLRILVDGR